MLFAPHPNTTPSHPFTSHCGSASILENKWEAWWPPSRPWSEHMRTLVFLVTLLCQAWNRNLRQLEGKRHLGCFLKGLEGFGFPFPH